MTRAEQFARLFHEVYERLAPNFGYETRPASQVPFDQLSANLQNLMVAVCEEVLPPTDDKLRPGQTVKEALDRCMAIVDDRRGVLERLHPAGREFSLAITAMEDAQMRYARGRHMQEGSFSPSDVDRWLADGRDPVAVRDERDAAAGKPE